MQIVPQKKGFLIYQGRQLIMKHSPWQPAIKVGRGNPKVQSHSGHFSIKEDRPKWFNLGAPEWKVVSENKIDISFERGDLSIHLEEKKSEIHFSFTCSNPEWNRFKVIFNEETPSRIFGAGELFDKLNLRGRKVPLWICEPGVGRRRDFFTVSVALKTHHWPKWYHRNYVSPSWITENGRYVLFNSSAYGVLDFSRKNKQGCYLWEIPEKITIGFQDSLLKAVSGFSDLIGRQPKLPDWVYDGVWLGIQGGSDVVEKKVNSVKKAGGKIGAVWCQDWEGIRMTSFGKQLKWSWEYDEKLYPQLPYLIKKLKEQGIQFLAYTNTFLTPGSDLFEEANSKGYLIKTQRGENYPVYVPFDPGYLVDFTNPQACKWLKEILKKNLIDLGISGWMADFGEYIPHNSVLHSGESPLTYHNRYPADWAKVNREVVSETKGDTVFFMRAASPFGIKNMSSFWTGDQLVDWSKEDGLPSAITACLSVGFSGIGYVHSDLGGYTTLGPKKRDRELLLRWAEFSAFTQTMRSHEGNRPGDNHQFDSDQKTLEGLSKMSRVFHLLKPYHKALSDEYQNTGIPPMRSCLLHYPTEASQLERHPYQYLYGEDLLVAPVIRKNAHVRTLYLPSGRWIHLWSGKSYSGTKRITVEAPLGQTPVFYREDTKLKELFKEVANVR